MTLRRLGVCILLAAVAFLCSLSIAKSERSTRLVLERAKKDVWSVIETVPALESLFDNLRENQTINIASGSSLVLTKPLVVDVGGITLRGLGPKMSTIICPQETSDSALVIRGVDMELEFMRFKGCRNASAVRIEPYGGTNFHLSQMTVSFTDVHFFRNGQSDTPVNGSAVSVLSCRDLICTQPQIQLQSCSFVNNIGTYGGAISIHTGHLFAVNTRFTNNRAHVAGGAISFLSTDGKLETLDSRFQRNEASWNLTNFDEMFDPVSHSINGMGGAILAVNPMHIRIDRSYFSRNRGCLGGGAVHVRLTDSVMENNSSAYIHDSTFDSNAAYCGTTDRLAHINLINLKPYIGGAVYFLSTKNGGIKSVIKNSRFRKNDARRGGALNADGTGDTSIDLQGCLFEDNSASGGGAMALYRAQSHMHSTIMCGNSAQWAGAVFVWLGASFNVTSNPKNSTDVSIIENGRAVVGGGIAARGSSIELRSLIIRNNTAFFEGGGVRFFRMRNTVVLAGVQIVSNTATVGGGGSFIGVNYINMRSHRGRPTQFANNVASIGGGIYLASPAGVPVQIKVTDTVFERNEAGALDHPALLTLKNTSHGYRVSQTTVEISPFEYVERYTGRDAVHEMASIPPGHGGGFCINTIDVGITDHLQLVFSNVTLRHNQAVVGGGASIHFRKLLWNEGMQKNCFPAVHRLDACQRLLLVNVTARKNEALFAAGIYSTHPDSVRLTCSMAETDPQYTLESAYTLQALHPSGNYLDKVCLKLQQNRIINESTSGGADVGSSAKGLMISGLRGGALAMVASGERLAVPCSDTRNTSCLQPLNVMIKDAFGQTITRGAPDSQMDLSLVSDNVVGATRYAARNGVVEILDTRARGIGAECNIIIRCDHIPDVQIRASFATRECYPGEIMTSEVCQKCQTDVYSFNTSEKECRPCEANAICRGGASLVPADGFWHSTPFSPQMHRCIYPKACSCEGRTHNLTHYYSDPYRVLDAMENLTMHLDADGPKPIFREYSQCGEGYEGILCGSCRDGFGHIYAGECKHCPDNLMISRLLLIATILSSLVIIGINTAATLLSANDRVALISFESEIEANRSKVQIAASTSCGVSRPPMRRLPSDSVQYTTRTANGRWEAKSALAKQLISTVQLAETLKVLVNYLQVTSAALRLPVNWTASVRDVLSFQAVIVGFTSEAMTVPFECNFEHGYRKPATVLAVLMRMATPNIVLGSLIVLYCIVWSIKWWRRVKNNEGNSASLSGLFTGIVIIFIVVTCFCYIENVREFVRSINCIDVDQTLSNSAHPYQRYAIETGHKIWAEDTDLICFHGEHTLVGILGIVGLCLAVVAVVFIIIWLPLNRTHVTERQFVQRYWFIYQAYRKTWYTLPWEAVILVRKALIATLLVFSFRLGPGLQASLCVGVLIVFHALHIWLQPFKTPNDHEYVPKYAGVLLRRLGCPEIAQRWIKFNNSISLNTLESISLLMSLLVFYTATILLQPNTTVASVHVLSICTSLSNAVFTLFLVYRLYSGLHVLFDLKLQIKYTNLDATFENGFMPNHLFRKFVLVVFATIRDYVENPNRFSDAIAETDA